MVAAMGLYMAAVKDHFANRNQTHDHKQILYAIDYFSILVGLTILIICRRGSTSAPTASAAPCSPRATSAPGSSNLWSWTGRCRLRLSGGSHDSWWIRGTSIGQPDFIGQLEDVAVSIGVKLFICEVAFNWDCHLSLPEPEDHPCTVAVDEGFGPGTDDVNQFFAQG